LSNDHLANSYPKSDAEINPRVNGNVGLQSDLDDTWQLSITMKNGDTLALSLNDIKNLPKTELVFDFKCIEGWSMITYWGGVKLSDFISAYHLNDEGCYEICWHVNTRYRLLRGARYAKRHASANARSVMK
jgi:DMSO/TMAO reductase YedYZ molybdopterin-dependent catalytic subunit